MNIQDDMQNNQNFQTEEARAAPFHKIEQVLIKSKLCCFSNREDRINFIGNVSLSTNPTYIGSLLSNAIVLSYVQSSTTGQYPCLPMPLQMFMTPKVENVYVFRTKKTGSTFNLLGEKEYDEFCKKIIDVQQTIKMVQFQTAKKRFWEFLQIYEWYIQKIDNTCFTLNIEFNKYELKLQKNNEGITLNNLFEWCSKANVYLTNKFFLKSTFEEIMEVISDNDNKHKSPVEEDQKVEEYEKDKVVLEENKDDEIVEEEDDKVEEDDNDKKLLEDDKEKEVLEDEELGEEVEEDEAEEKDDNGGLEEDDEKVVEDDNNNELLEDDEDKELLEDDTNNEIVDANNNNVNNSIETASHKKKGADSVIDSDRNIITRDDVSIHTDEELQANDNNQNSNDTSTDANFENVVLLGMTTADLVDIGYKFNRSQNSSELVNCVLKRVNSSSGGKKMETNLARDTLRVTMVMNHPSVSSVYTVSLANVSDVKYHKNHISCNFTDSRRFVRRLKEQGFGADGNKIGYLIMDYFWFQPVRMQ